MCIGRRLLKSIVDINVIGCTNLAAVDLNRLIAFEALLAERNASRVARRIDVALDEQRCRDAVDRGA